MSSPFGTIAIVGATGAVGQEVLAILAARGHDARAIRVFASERSAGRLIRYRDDDLEVRALREGCFQGVRYAIFTAGAGISREWAPVASSEGAMVIDNSSAFRMAPDVPLVVPEVNASALVRAPRRIVANPNCSTILLVVALNPILRAFGISRVVLSTYQAVSGAGAKAMGELERQTRRVLEGERPTPAVFHEPCAFNLFSHNSAVEVSSGVNGEERKIIDESRKIWDRPDLSILPTCVRVPVMRAHAESVAIELQRPASEQEVRAAIARAPGVRLVDDRARNDFPTPLKATGHDAVLVGRLRPAPCEAPDSQGRYLGYSLFLCGDQLRKGAALNALQIAELLGCENPLLCGTSCVCDAGRPS